MGKIPQKSFLIDFKLLAYLKSFIYADFWFNKCGVIYFVHQI